MFFVQFFHDGGGSEENKSFLQVVFLSRFLSRLNDLNLEDFPKTILMNTSGTPENAFAISSRSCCGTAMIK